MSESNLQPTQMSVAKPDERKPVICRCGRNMGYMPFPDFKEDGKERGAYICLCGWRAPVGRGATQEDAERAAYAAATQRPPNRALSLPALFEMGEADAVWVVSENGRIWAMGAECAQEWASEEHCLFFASKPTNADIAAARKERND